MLMPGHYKHYFTFREFPKKVSFLCLLFVHFYREIFFKGVLLFFSDHIVWVSSIIIIENEVSESHGRQKKKKKVWETFYHWHCKVRIGCLPSIILFSTSANLASVFFPPSIRVKALQPAKGNAETHSNTEPDIGIL